MAITPDVRNAVTSIDSDATLYRVLSMEGVILRMTWFYPVCSTLFMAFGSGALLLAAVGNYGVMSFAVSRRTQELGVRMALGARAGSLEWFVMRHGMLQLGIGLGIGLMLTVLVAGPVRILLLEVDTLDPAVIGTVALILAAIGLFANYFPSRRITGIDPMAALNSE